MDTANSNNSSSTPHHTRDALTMEGPGELVQWDQQHSPQQHDNCWGEWDVPLGRSGEVRDHIGNVRFRALVNHYRGAYLKATKRIDKTFISTSILGTISANGGRFLDKGEFCEDGWRWVEIPDEKALAKISQALRLGTGRKRCSSSESASSPSSPPQSPTPHRNCPPAASPPARNSTAMTAQNTPGQHQQQNGFGWEPYQPHHHDFQETTSNSEPTMGQETRKHDPEPVHGASLPQHDPRCAQKQQEQTMSLCAMLGNSIASPHLLDWDANDGNNNNNVPLCSEQQRQQEGWVQLSHHNNDDDDDHHDHHHHTPQPPQPNALAMQPREESSWSFLDGFAPEVLVPDHDEDDNDHHGGDDNVCWEPIPLLPN